MNGPTDSTALLVTKLADLERRVRRLQTALAGGVLAVGTVALVAFTSPQSQGAGIVTARRLVLTDSVGRPTA